MLTLVRFAAAVTRSATSGRWSPTKRCNYAYCLLSFSSVSLLLPHLFLAVYLLLAQTCYRGHPASCQTAPRKPASGVRPGTKLPPDKPAPGPPPPGAVQASVYNSTATEVVILSNLVTAQPICRCL